MSEKIFETMVKKPKSTLKWLFFPVSLLFHGLLIAGIIVVPLMSEQSRLPEVKVYDLLLMAPAPPQTPSPPKGKREGNKGSGESKPRPVKPKPSTIRRFVPPIDIPEDIPEEKFDDIVTSMHLGDDGDVVGGITGIDIDRTGDYLLGKKDADGSSSEPVRLTNVQPPRLIKRVAPDYPNAPMKAHIEGVVTIEAVTDIYGRVIKVKVTSGHPLLRGAAVQAVKQWIYEPYILNGIPRPVTFTVNVHFKLQR
ncbi:MAG: energy transducer TonB [Candidatus Aminicenantes bacterium]|jgi:TonB family protein